MGRSGPKIVEDFILPHLLSKTFGSRLVWANEKEKIFLVKWKHKSDPGWVMDDVEVFLEWDKLKKRDLKDQVDPEMKSKQRFRAALRKIDTVFELPNAKGYKRYKIRPVKKKGGDQEVMDEYPCSPVESTLYSTSSASPCSSTFSASPPPSDEMAVGCSSNEPPVHELSYINEMNYTTVYNMSAVVDVLPMQDKLPYSVVEGISVESNPTDDGNITEKNLDQRFPDGEQDVRSDNNTVNSFTSGPLVPNIVNKFPLDGCFENNIVEFDFAGIAFPEQCNTGEALPTEDYSMVVPEEASPSMPVQVNSINSSELLQQVDTENIIEEACESEWNVDDWFHERGYYTMDH